MRPHFLVGAAILALAASPAFAQSHTTTTVDEASGTTTTRTVEHDPGGAAPGALGGAVAGAVVAGPVGAVVGAVGGAVVGHSVAPPSEVQPTSPIRTPPRSPTGAM